MRGVGRWLWAAVAAAVLMAGCGDKAAPLTRAEFTKRANAHCGSAAKALRRLPEPKTRAGFERTVNRSGFIVQRLYDKLTPLKPPQRDAARYDRFLDLFEGDLKAVRGVLRAVLHQRLTRLAGLESGRLPAANRETRLAKQLGIPRCAGVAIIDVPEPPKPPTRAALPARPSIPGPAGNAPLGADVRSEFIAGCSVRASRAGCVCLYEQLTRRYGIDTNREFLELALKTRRAALNGDPRDLPEPVKGATIACQSKILYGS